MTTQIEAREWTFASSSTITELIDLTATDKRASLGHLENQSIVQQFTREGNMRQRRLQKSEKLCIVFKSNLSFNYYNKTIN